MASQRKTSEQLEREIEARRARIETRVDDISARLSPGQLLDEALQYTRSGPGADFTRNLSRSVVQNPLPVALVGASLGWLAIQSNLPKRKSEPDYGPDPYYDSDDEDYPVAIITGRTINRTGSSEDQGNRYSEFADSTGRKFKAATNEIGHRTGHFADETGRLFRGFVDETGNHVSDFRDEAGNRLHQASGWASHNWRKAGKGLSQVGRSAREGAEHMSEQAHRAGHGLRRQGEGAVHAADDFIHDQPLVSGAIAFAIGALLGGVLPHTREEDELLGSASDAVKRNAADEAGHLYERGRDEAERLHEEARHAAGDVYEKAKDAVRHGSDGSKSGNDTASSL